MMAQTCKENTFWQSKVKVQVCFLFLFAVFSNEIEKTCSLYFCGWLAMLLTIYYVVVSEWRSSVPLLTKWWPLLGISKVSMKRIEPESDAHWLQSTLTYILIVANVFPVVFTRQTNRHASISSYLYDDAFSILDTWSFGTWTWKCNNCHGHCQESLCCKILRNLFDCLLFF